MDKALDIICLCGKKALNDKYGEIRSLLSTCKFKDPYRGGWKDWDKIKVNGTFFALCHQEYYHCALYDDSIYDGEWISSKQAEDLEEIICWIWENSRS